MDSLYGLTYKKLNLSNLSIAYKIQKEEWPDEEAYDDLYDKTINPTDDNCFFLVYDKNEIIGIAGVDFYDEYPDSIWLDWFWFVCHRHSFDSMVRHCVCNEQ